MIHFFPELSSLYHRCLIVSANKDRKGTFWDEWTKSLWGLCPNKNSFLSILPKEAAAASGFYCCSLGNRNPDEQKIVGFQTSIDAIKQQPELIDFCDSLLVEVDPNSENSEGLFSWQPPPSLTSKRVVWCLRSPLSPEAPLHVKALDQKLVELSPESRRILWPKGQFIRDALEWVMSF